ncbi:unnamed protein product [Ectocarpus sp. 6 AP-2014]
MQKQAGDVQSGDLKAVSGKNECTPWVDTVASTAPAPTNHPGRYDLPSPSPLHATTAACLLHHAKADSTWLQPRRCGGHPAQAQRPGQMPQPQGQMKAILAMETKQKKRKDENICPHIGRIWRDFAPGFLGVRLLLLKQIQRILTGDKKS